MKTRKNKKVLTYMKKRCIKNKDNRNQNKNKINYKKLN